MKPTEEQDQKGHEDDGPRTILRCIDQCFRQSWRGRPSSEAPEARREVTGLPEDGAALHPSGRDLINADKWFRSAHLVIVAIAFVLATSSPAAAQRFATGGPYNTPAGKVPMLNFLREVGIEQHLDAQLPLDTPFRDEEGREVRLGDYFADKPVVLSLVQYRCPMLCTQVLNGFLKASHAMPLEVGRDFHFVAISFDAREGSELATEKKKHYARVYRRAGAQQGLHFLTGDQQSIDRITQAIGFHYRYVARNDQFAHASGVVIATPEGRLARYFYGIEYSPHDLRLGLVESSNGRIGSPADQVLLLCYHYDPLTGKYGLAIAGLLRWAGILTVIALAAFLVRHVSARSQADRN